MRLIRKWGILLVLGGILGVFLGYNGAELSGKTLLIIFGCVLIVALALNIIQTNYVLRYSRNDHTVAKTLQRLSRSTPYFAAISDLLEGRTESAAARLGSIKNDKLRAVVGAAIAMENGLWHEAEKHIHIQDNNDARNTSKALLRLYQDDWKGYEEAKRLVDHQGLQYALEADAAFRRGDLAKADELGELAIAHTAGMQRYALIRYRELRSKEPQRRNYF
ncbi:conserved hypothetical protein [Paenibacillus curdlanolyticus YK9]|uniref:Uncharacterized protein n=1 Tax=Paenibacillus curdlanolyticus YK9 TaxID=717606 RepID=E0IF83_9BACL|nr:hypothetical protein [Paenibacillus curdlanolyticus]EFM08859.1 conserved hypothetical protein [Paenibacillus curdlanolyticus YK9]